MVYVRKCCKQWEASGAVVSLGGGGEFGVHI
jgi:hypothetical protein